MIRPAALAGPTLGESLAALSDPDVRELAGLAWVAVLGCLVPDPHAEARAVAPTYGRMYPDPDDLTDVDRAHAARWVHEIEKAGDPSLDGLRGLTSLPWPRWWPWWAPDATRTGDPTHVE